MPLTLGFYIYCGADPLVRAGPPGPAFGNRIKIRLGHLFGPPSAVDACPILRKHLKRTQTLTASPQRFQANRERTVHTSQLV